tara:strand:+ start:671 stop:937 length:267 start_codon:yes stop_codon:yes gene_type:complete
MELNEYIIDVDLYNKKDKLKVWATNSTEAIDSMLALEMVTKIYSVKRLSDDKSWKFTGDINLLRDIRNEIDDEGLINSEMIKQGEVND